MTATRDPDRLLRAWLDLMPDEAPDRVIQSVLQATQGAPQARALPWNGIRRSPRMNRLTLIAAAALVAVALVGGAIFVSSGRQGPVVPTPNPTLSPSPVPSPTALDVVAPAPQTTWGDWIADAEQIPGASNRAQRIQLSVNWDGGRTAWVQLNDEDGRLVVESSSLAAPDGEIWLRADAGSTGCSFGDDGRYRWDRSTDGLFLTLELISDDCEPRAIALARTWVRSHGAVSDGGRGVLYGMDPDVMVTMPRGQRYGLGGGDHAAELKTFGDSLPFRAFVAIKNPGGFGAPCASGDAKKIDIAHTTQAFGDYVKDLPGATVTPTDATIGGRPGTRLDVSIDPNVTCNLTDGIRAFHPELQSDAAQWTFNPGEAETLYILQMDAANTLLLWYQGAAGEEATVMDTVTFVDALPTP